MNRVFADTSYYVALTNPRDQLHAVATQFLASYGSAIVTTEFVLVEVANFLSRSRIGRHTFQTLDAQLRAAPEVTIYPATSDLYARGLKLFTARPDKDWSLTDCISFDVMAELEITDALTADEHFEQAGYCVLLKPGASA
jgi:uncharacterized protein